MGYTVLVSNFRRYFKLASYVSTFTDRSIVIAMGVPSLKASIVTTTYPWLLLVQHVLQGVCLLRLAQRSAILCRSSSMSGTTLIWRVASSRVRNCPVVCMTCIVWVLQGTEQ